MTTGYRDFCEKYKEKIANDKDIRENEVDFQRDYRDRITFSISIYSTCPQAVRSPRMFDETTMFTLDEEDLKYLYDKYSKKLEAEMEANIAKVKGSYKDALDGQ